MKEPLVSICCITYNHKNYIRDAIEGFLMQKTTFEIEILIHDDASTDGTDEIIRDYESKFPEIIKPLYEEENQWSLGRKGSIVFNIPRARGKYIALCEGDDYWTDPFKLQKQVDFLERNSNHSMCFHGAKVISESNYLNNSIFSNLQNRDYNSDELLEKWIVPTASVVFRKELFNKIPQSEKFIYGDIITFLTMAAYGKVRCIDEAMSVYRRTKKGVVLSENVSPDYYWRFIEHFKEIFQKFPKVTKTVVDKRIAYQYSGICLYYIRKKQIKNFVSYFRMFFIEYRKVFLKAFISGILRSTSYKISQFAKNH